MKPIRRWIYDDRLAINKNILSYNIMGMILEENILKSIPSYLDISNNNNALMIINYGDETDHIIKMYKNQIYRYIEPEISKLGYQLSYDDIVGPYPKYDGYNTPIFMFVGGSIESDDYTDAEFIIRFTSNTQVKKSELVTIHTVINISSCITGVKLSYTPTQRYVNLTLQ